MDDKVKKGGSAGQGQVKQIENEMGLRKGPWTVDEDAILVNYITSHGEGHWNNVARCAGLNRSGKSCRLRWLNYLRPDVRRGNITLEEQILILELHSRWGNRWSRIAQHMPGRTDNEIKNYWRTRVIKQAKQLKCDVNSKQFRDVVRYVWMPRLLERLHPASPQPLEVQKQLNPNPSGTGFLLLHQNQLQIHSSDSGTEWVKPNPYSSSSCASGTSSDSSSAEFQVPSRSDHTDSSQLLGHVVSVHSLENVSDSWPSFNDQMFEQGNGGAGDSLQGLWNDENIWFLQQ